MIFKQDIRAVTEVKRGTTINLTVSLGPKES
jgi:beta-lactam-binding protein with PASTA domain